MQAEQASKQFRQATELHRQGQLEQALPLYEEILQSFPRHADTLHMLGVLATQSNREDEAVRLIRKAIDIAPQKAAFHASLGNAQKRKGCMEDAISSYQRAVDMDPKLVGAHYNLGMALQENCRYEAAVESYDRALALNPRYTKALLNRGSALHALKRFREAIASFDMALAIQPDYVRAIVNRGIAMQALGRLRTAIDILDHAVAMDPENANTHYNRGNILHELGRPAEAAASFKQALKLDPDLDFLHGLMLHEKMYICDWEGHETDCSELLGKVSQGKKASPSLALLAVTDEPGIQRRAAETWVRDQHPASFAPKIVIEQPAPEKIRVAYFSGDFQEHPVSLLTAGLYEHHDRDRFETFAFSYGPGGESPMRARLESAFDHFIDVRHQADAEIAQLSRDRQIDIGIDLGGLTTGARMGIFASRAAPLQVNFLGYPGSVGADYIDYLIADPVLVPEEFRDGYSEKIVYLPCFQPCDDRRQMSERRFTRQELGLPPSGFVFCCFNNNYKITPQMLDDWMHIIGQVKKSVLLLLEDNKQAAHNLRKEAGKRGMDPARLVFSGRLPYPEYLARYRSADLFLDTFPFNGGTTVSDTLWAGLPVLTLSGRSFASRMAASLLTAAGLPEMVAGDRDEYRSLAVALATNPEKLSRVRERLEQSRQSAPVFDTGRYTRSLEQACLEMVTRHRNGYSPTDIHVDTAGTSGPVSG